LDRLLHQNNTTVTLHLEVKAAKCLNQRIKINLPFDHKSNTNRAQIGHKSSTDQAQI